MTNKRECNFELLRVLCMFMVVVSHCFGHGGVLEKTVFGSVNWHIGNILTDLCIVCVNCFVLISGYFLCDSKFKLKKTAYIWLSALTYSLAIYLLLADNFSAKEILKRSMVFSLDRYWFVTDYILLLLVSPILNTAIKAMDKRIHLISCGILLLVFTVLPQFTLFIKDFTGVNKGFSLQWFCVLYVVAAYFRKYVPKLIKYQKYTLLMYFVFVLMISCSRFVLISLLGREFTVFNTYNSIPCVLATLCLFQFYRGLYVKENKFTYIIQKMSPLTFGVYLIHEQDDFRPVLWKALRVAEQYDKSYMLLYVLGCCLTIFIICCLIERVRISIFDKFRIQYAFNSMCDNIQFKIRRMIEALE